MAYWHYDRLSALDAMFLRIEEPNVHMHVGAVAIFDSGPLRTDDGTLEIDRIREAIDASLANSPRFRQKLAWIPRFDQPVWIDDPHFHLTYHVRHTSLPRPGSVRMLKRLAGRIFSQKLDRGKPLWEMWVVEGLEDDRFAIIVKAHHCMVDGISGLDLLAGMMRLDPEPSIAPRRAWIPRPAPPGSRLYTEEFVRRLGFPLSLVRSGLDFVRDPGKVVGAAREGLLGLGEMFQAGLTPTSPNPLNPDIGPYRRFDWTRMEIAAAREVKASHGGTVNDVALACASGAVGSFMRQRGLNPGDLVFRAQVPMSTRTAAQRHTAGNRVVMLMADLPLGEEDPGRRLDRVIETTKRLKGSRQPAGVEFLEELSDRTTGALFEAFARFATQQRSYNLVVTNIPGPRQPLYLRGAKLLEIYPMVPLAGNQALGIALFSYQGVLHWGLNACWDTLPDIHHFVEDLDTEFERLHKASPGAR